MAGALLVPAAYAGGGGGGAVPLRGMHMHCLAASLLFDFVRVSASPPLSSRERAPSLSTVTSIDVVSASTSRPLRDRRPSLTVRSVPVRVLTADPRAQRSDSRSGLRPSFFLPCRNGFGSGHSFPTDMHVGQ